MNKNIEPQNAEDLDFRVEDDSCLMRETMSTQIHVQVSSPVTEPYSKEELQARHDEAVREFRSGCGMEGDEFFSKMEQYILSR